MGGVIKSTVAMRIKTHQFQTLKTAEILTAAGLRSNQLIPASIIFQCITNYSSHAYKRGSVSSSKNG